MTVYIYIIDIGTIHTDQHQPAIADTETCGTICHQPPQEDLQRLRYDVYTEMENTRGEKERGQALYVL